MTNEMKYTPEPWYYEADDTPENGYDNLYLYTIKERTPLDAGEAKISYVATRITYEKDARLISAAQELLDALLEALPYVEDALDDECFKKGAVAKSVKKIRTAIAKATSATPTGQAA